MTQSHAQPPDAARKTGLVLLFAALAFLSVASLGTWPCLFEDEALARCAMNLAADPLGWPRLYHQDPAASGARLPDIWPSLAPMEPAHLGMVFNLPLGWSQITFGQTVLAARAVSFVFVWLSLPFLWGILRRSGSPPTEASLLTALVMSSLTATILAHKVRPEAALVPCLFLTLWLLLRMERSSAGAALGLGLVAAGALEVHVTFFLPLLAVLNLLLLVRFRSVRLLAWANLPAVFVFVFWIWLRYGHFGEWNFLPNLHRNVEHWAGEETGALARLAKLAEHFRAQWDSGAAMRPELIASLAAFPAAAWVLLRERRRLREPPSLLALAFLAWPILVLLQGRINGNYLQPMFLLAPPLLWLALPARVRGARRAHAALLLLVAFNLSVLTHKAWASRHSLDSLPRVADVLAANIPPGARVLGNETLYFVAPRMELIGPWDLDMALRKQSFASYMERMRIEYLVDTRNLDTLDPTGASANVRTLLQRDFHVVHRSSYPLRAANTFLKAVPGGASCELVILKRKEASPDTKKNGK